MGTFRYSAALLLCCLACVQVEPITRDTIEHLLPKRDAVGAAPARFEWTAAKNADEYAITVENEVDVLIFEGRSRSTFIDWPKGNALDPGTYFWRVVGLSQGRRVADSGRAAFVVSE